MSMHGPALFATQLLIAALPRTNRTIYVAPLNSTTTTPVTFPLLSGGEFFWLDARTLAHVVGDDIYAVSLEYEVAPEGSSLVNVPTAPYLVGSFPSGSGATNFKFTGSKKVHATDDTEQPILVFSAAVFVPHRALNHCH